MAKKSGIPGLSFSWKCATGITAAKRSIAKATGIPTTKSGRQRKFHVSIGGGNRRSSPGSGSRGSSSGGGCSWGLIKWLLVIFLVVGGGMNIKASPVAAVISAILGLLLAGWPLIVLAIPALREKRAEKHGEELKARGEIESDRLRFTLEPPSAEIQAELREQKLSDKAVPITCEPDPEAGLRFSYRGTACGVPEPVRSWIAGHATLIDTEDVYSSPVGGGVSEDGSDRPFTWQIMLKLKKAAAHPDDVNLIGRAALIDGVDSSTPVCIASTGRLHACPPTCGVSALGTQRAILCEVDLSEHPVCQRCFRDR